MGCECKKRRQNLDYIRKLAVNFSRISRQDVQIYSYIDDNELYYNFEPIDTKRENIIEYIKI